MLSLDGLNFIHWFSTLVFLALSLYALRFAGTRMGKALFLFFVLTGLWSVFAAMIYTAPTLEEKIAFNRLKMIAPILLPLSCFLVATAFHGAWKWNWIQWLLLLPMPFVCLGLMAFDSTHTWLIQNYGLMRFGDDLALSFTNGPFFPYQNLYSRLVIITALVILLKSALSVHPAHQKKAWLIFLSFLVPFVTDSFAVFVWPEFRYLQLTPSILVLSGITLSYAILIHGVLDVVPIARSYLVDHLPEPYLVVNSEGQVVDFNVAAKKFFGLETKNVGRPLSKLLPAGSPFQEILNPQIASQSVSILEEGAERVFEIASHDLKTPSGRHLAKLIGVKDVTVFKKLEKELRDINEMKSRFLGILAHDLTSHVRSLALVTSSLRGQASPAPEIQPRLELIQRASDEMSQFIERLSGWAKSQMSLLRPQREKVDLAILAREVLNFLEIVAVEKRVHLRLQGDPELPAFVDVEMIRTVLRNLIENALKFTPPEAEVVVELKAGDQQHRLSVIDQGEGIPSEDIQQMFRIDVAPTKLRASQVRSLGLLLCDEFVRVHGGRIQVESELQRGSVFTICLPIDDEDVGLDAKSSLSS